MKTRLPKKQEGKRVEYKAELLCARRAAGQSATVPKLGSRRLRVTQISSDFVESKMRLSPAPGPSTGEIINMRRMFAPGN